MCELREYELRLDKYNIDKELYRELRARSRRYDSMVAELQGVRQGFNSHEITGMPRDSSPGDPTSRRALRAITLRKSVEEIEQAALAADGTLHEQILNNVTRGVRYEDMDVPCGRRQFYETRRKYFWCYAQIREYGAIPEIG